VDLIVVTATRTEREIGEAAIPTQVIERDDILRTSARSIEEVLDRIPGIFVRTNEPFRMGASTVRMQGADSNKVAILLDGRRFRGGVDGVVDVRDIPVANIQRIEVVRGPASSLYGSDAMGGVINIITRGGTEEPSLDVTAGAGSFDGLLLSASHGYRLGDLSYFVSAQHSESQVARELGTFSSQFDGEAGDAIQSRTDVFLDVDYALAEGHELSFVGDVNPVREGPQSERFNMSLTGDWRWTPSDDTAARLGVSRYSFDRDNDLPGFQEDVSYVDWTFDVIGSHSFAGFFDDAHTASVGFVHRRQAIDSRGIERMFADGTSFTPPSVDEAVYTNSPFLQDEIELWPGVSAVLGLSIDKHSEFDAQANPRVALSWNPLSSIRLAALYGRGYRAPDLLQLYDSDFNNVVGIGPDGMPLGYAIIGNPDLEPETDNAWNLQLDFDPHPAVSGFLTLFRHDFRDLITNALCDEECRAGYGGVLPALVFTNENWSCSTAPSITPSTSRWDTRSSTRRIEAAGRTTATSYRSGRRTDSCRALPTSTTPGSRVCASGASGKTARTPTSPIPR